MLKDPKKYRSLQDQGLQWAKEFSWEKTYLSVSKILKSIPYKILWLSWRDIKNPAAGGAERVAIETAKRFAKEKVKITIFSSSFKGAKPRENVNGVEILRSGNLISCRFLAFLYYLKNRDVNLVIDEINTIPFFSVFYAPNKTVALIHQLAREYWFTQTIWPINWLGYFLEPFFLKLYKKRPTIVVSKSTKKDLENLNFQNIEIIREGLDFKPSLPKIKSDILLFIGRLTAAKGPQEAISAFKFIAKAYPQTKLYIIGHGDKKFINYLRKLTASLNLTKKVTFTGFIPQNEKIKFLKESKVILVPSVREGWNLVVTEANATGCIPIAYNVPGLRDSVKNGKTGLLVQPTSSSLAQATINLLGKPNLRKNIEKKGFAFSQKFCWDNTYMDIKEYLFQTIT